MATSKPKAAPESIIAELWRRGELRWKLKRCQVVMLDAILGSGRFKFIVKCARRLGKSYLLCLFAIETCLKKPGAQVRYAAPTAKALRKIVRPIMNKILRDCPDELRPRFISSEGMYVFPNGSEIHLAGVNSGNADDLRGTACDLFLIDEARDIDELHYLVHDVAMPQFLDPDGNVVRGRRLVVASSPAHSSGHEFTVMAQEAKAEGNYAHYDIFAGQYPADVIRMFLIEDGVPEADVEALLAGRHTEIKSTTVKREYLAMDVIDEEVAIVGEWRPRFIFERKPEETDKYLHRYLWMDIGVQRDLTVILLVLYDFPRAMAYIEDEVVIKGPIVTTALIAKELKAKIEEAGRREYQDCYRRIADNSHPLLLNDLSFDHQILFSPTDKGRLHEMVNTLKMWVKDGRLGAHPRCRHTTGSLEAGTWNKQRTEFARSEAFGHYDAIAACVYGVRNVDENTNPIPEHIQNPWLRAQKQQLSETGKTLKKAFQR